jgi:hypothetical protein
MASSLLIGVSFVKTPLAEISAKTAAIEALGWRPRDRGDPWVVSYFKDFATDLAASDAEVRAVMGDYWVDADAMRARHI